ncbi:hypothetical protein B0H13DRAFT_2461105 [Mycena leptocephala]|nr:hypothetical protein B0H13DRAFT_2461105 [Mycena leptocephala]
MFFQGVHTALVTVDKTKPEGKIDDKGNDKEVMRLIFTKLAPEYQHLGDNVTCAQVRCYLRGISTIEDAVTPLDRLGVKPSESEIADTLLMNLDDSLASTCTILTAEKEPTFLAIKSQIRNAGPSVPLKPVKKEEDDNDDIPNSLSAHAARTQSKGSRTRAPRAFGTSGSSKFHWCSATSNDQCRRCGVSGHISDRCIHDMPSDVKDWVLAGPPGKHARTSAAYHSGSSDDEFCSAESDSDDEVNQYGYFTMSA